MQAFGVIGAAGFQVGLSEKALSLDPRLLWEAARSLDLQLVYEVAF